MHYIPATVEEIPVVAVHADMGPHDVIWSPTTIIDIKAIIDWEFWASVPYASLHRVIEMLFRKSTPNEFGAEYAYADELRDTFWGAIPEWRTWNAGEATRVILKWLRFGLFMKAEWRPDGLNEEEKERYWKENVRVVEGMLRKYGPARGAS